MDLAVLEEGKRTLKHAAEAARASVTANAGVATNQQTSGWVPPVGGIASRAFSFPMVLHSMIEYAEEHQYDCIVSWQCQGRAFKVHEPKRFVTDVAPHFFRQTRYKSFQRQLALYGFKRSVISGSPDEGCYRHEYFVRGMPELCRRIQRVNSQTSYKRKSSGDEASNLLIADYSTSSTTTPNILLNERDLILSSTNIAVGTNVEGNSFSTEQGNTSSLAKLVLAQNHVQNAVMSNANMAMIAFTNVLPFPNQQNETTGSIKNSYNATGSIPALQQQQYASHPNLLQLASANNLNLKSHTSPVLPSPNVALQFQSCSNTLMVPKITGSNSNYQNIQNEASPNCLPILGSIAPVPAKPLTLDPSDSVWLKHQDIAQHNLDTSNSHIYNSGLPNTTSTNFPETTTSAAMACTLTTQHPNTLDYTLQPIYHQGCFPVAQAPRSYQGATTTTNNHIVGTTASAMLSSNTEQLQNTTTSNPTIRQQQSQWDDTVDDDLDFFLHFDDILSHLREGNGGGGGGT